HRGGRHGRSVSRHRRGGPGPRHRVPRPGATPGLGPRRLRCPRRLHRQLDQRRAGDELALRARRRRAGAGRRCHDLVPGGAAAAPGLGRAAPARLTPLPRGSGRARPGSQGGGQVMSRTTGTDAGITRRQALGRSMALLGGLAAGGGLVSVPRAARGATTEVTFQLGWIVSNGQIGEVVARSLGYFEAEGLTLKITPGGPNVDGVAIVASGSAQVGNLSSSPSLMLARAGPIPVKCIAVGYQEHPFTYFSLPKRPIRTPQDMIGKKIGTQGTARILLRALLAQHKIKESDVQVVVIGSEYAPLMTGQ